MSEQTKDRAEQIVNELQMIKRRITDVTFYASNHVKDPELINQLNKLGEQTSAIRESVTKKLGKSAG